MTGLDHTRADGRAETGSTVPQPNSERAEAEVRDHLRRAQTALRRNRRNEALSHYRRARGLIADHPHLCQAVGALGLQLGDYSGCIEALQGFIAHAGEVPDALNCMGNAWLRSGHPQAAIACQERALSRSGQNPKLWHDLATAYLHAGNPASAVMGYSEVLRLCPNHRGVHYNLGTALLAAGRNDEAEQALLLATQREPKHAESHMHLGLARQRLGRLEGALTAQRTAQRLSPDDPEVTWNLALTELLAGELKSGFHHFEARLRIKGHPLSKRKLWDGRPLPNEPLVLAGEQGLGDTLQFLRFAERAAARCPNIVLECRADLLPLLEHTYRGPVTLRAWGAQGGGAQGGQGRWTASLMSLPHLLDATDELMCVGAYLIPDSSRVDRYRKALPESGLRVGLNWQGNPAYRADRQRSMPLEYLAPLWSVPGSHFISLQHGPGRDQLSKVNASPIDWGNLDPPGAAFIETAHALSALSLLITTDTAVAHLAGALGVEVWLLLAHLPDFRWGLVGNRWYPTMRIFRQPHAGDWTAVVAEVRGELERRAATRGAS